MPSNSTRSKSVSESTKEEQYGYEGKEIWSSALHCLLALGSFPNIALRRLCENSDARRIGEEEFRAGLETYALIPLSVLAEGPISHAEVFFKSAKFPKATKDASDGVRELRRRIDLIDQRDAAASLVPMLRLC